MSTVAEWTWETSPTCATSQEKRDNSSRQVNTALSFRYNLTGFYRKIHQSGLFCGISFGWFPNLRGNFLHLTASVLYTVKSLRIMCLSRVDQRSRLASKCIWRSSSCMRLIVEVIILHEKCMQLVKRHIYFAAGSLHGFTFPRHIIFWLFTV